MFHAKNYHHDHFDPVTLCNIFVIVQECDGWGSRNPWRIESF